MFIMSYVFIFAEAFEVSNRKSNNACRHFNNWIQYLAIFIVLR